MEIKRLFAFVVVLALVSGCGQGTVFETVIHTTDTSTGLSALSYVNHAYCTIRYGNERRPDLPFVDRGGPQLESHIFNLRQTDCYRRTRMFATAKLTSRNNHRFYSSFLGQVNMKTLVLSDLGIELEENSPADEHSQTRIESFSDPGSDPSAPPLRILQSKRFKNP